MFLLLIFRFIDLFIYLFIYSFIYVVTIFFVFLVFLNFFQKHNAQWKMFASEFLLSLSHVEWREETISKKWFEI